MNERQPFEPGGLGDAEAAAERQRRIEALADEYLDRLLAGETPDRQAFVADHQDLADELAPRLELVELMHRVAQARQSVDGGMANDARAQVPAERVVRVKCPHCGNGIHLVEPEAREVTCAGCGSSFRVDPQATTSYPRAALPRTVGKFEVLEAAGRGAYGTVYKARDPELRRVVAVKVPRAGTFGTPEAEERFLREARAAAQLNHPGIVPVLQVAYDHGVPYIVSEYVEGPTLADVLTARRPPFREAAELIAAVADALDYAHRQNVVHRDIKPSNLLLDAHGRPHITDFGLARHGDGEFTVTLDGQILGTPAYMAPEQAAGNQRLVDAKSDVYSLGVVLYELLTGELPFRGNQRMLLHQVLHDEPRPPRGLNDRVPRDLETICLKAMAKAPGRRYGSARELADDLRRYLAGEPIRARRVGAGEKLARWARRKPVVATLIATVALLLIAVAVVSTSFAVYQRRANRDLADANRSIVKNQRESELRAASDTVDDDLAHCNSGAIEYGVLRLARTLGSLPAHATDLRQCAEMNLVAWVQELLVRPDGDEGFESLLRPTFEYDGAETTWELSPDGLTVLIGGVNGTARLCDAFSGEVRATLVGHRGEIVSVGFSQNGRVAMTCGEDQTVRLWEARDGRLRAVVTERLDLKYGDTKLLSPDGARLLTIRDEKQANPPWRHVRSAKTKMIMTLWDTSAGKNIGVLAGHEGRINAAAFSPDGELLLTGGWKSARLWSAQSGRALATLGEQVNHVGDVAFSADGSLVATLEYSEGSGHSRVTWWDRTGTRPMGPPCIVDHTGSGSGSTFRFIERDVVVMDGLKFHNAPGGCFVRGSESSFPLSPAPQGASHADDEFVVDSGGNVYDRKSGKLQFPPTGRKFGDACSRFAVTGRFVVFNGQLVDLRTEKRIGPECNWGTDGDQYVYLAERQMFVARSGFYDGRLRYISIPNSPLDAHTARLFAEVVTCHELDPQGTTRPLDEAAWEQCRNELAARLPKPTPASLIGRVAADRFHWLRLKGTRFDEDLQKNYVIYLDRLIALDPTWQEHYRRGVLRYQSTNNLAAARDFLDAGARAGSGIWRFEGPLKECARQLVASPNGSLDEYQVGLQLAQAIAAAVPDDRGRRIVLAIALYRTGHYHEALTRLDVWQRERQIAIAAEAGLLFVSELPLAEIIAKMPISWDVIQAAAFSAMALHRLGQTEQARAALADLRNLGNRYPHPAVETISWSTYDWFHELLGEAESLIEGAPAPTK